MPFPQDRKLFVILLQSLADDEVANDRRRGPPWPLAHFNVISDEPQAHDAPVVHGGGVAGSAVDRPAVERYDVARFAGPIDDGVDAVVEI